MDVFLNAVPEKTPTLCVNPPTSVVLYLKVLSSVIESTKKSPLYPVTPAPVRFVSDLTFLIRTLSPILKSCGCSVRTVTILFVLSYVQVVINLLFLLYLPVAAVILVRLNSLSVSGPVELDS